MHFITIGLQDRVFVLTGAGISAESGIPTFRDANGLWHGYRIEEVASPEAWARDPAMVWEFYSMRRKGAAPCRPNAGHIALAGLEERIANRFFLCTQNVDNLHEHAGSKRLVHMHGELFKSRCDRCNRPPFEDTSLYESREQIPHCPCGGLIRPNIVWFGEMIHGMDVIAGELARCTVMLVVGTSGVVYPAAGFVHVMRERLVAGESVSSYYVGPEEPANAAAFTSVFSGKAATVLPFLIHIQE